MIPELYSKEDPSHGGHARWLRKDVRSAIDLPTDSLSLEGPGHIQTLTDGAILLTAPTTLPVKNPANRYYALSIVKLNFSARDLTAYNRFSCEVFVDAPFYESLMLQFAIHNQGEKIMPVPGRFEGIHHEQVIPGQWHKVIWELPDLARDCATAFAVHVPVQGILPGGGDEVKVFIRGARMELVEAENSRGFDLRRGSIAYCHSGYLSHARKQALAQHVPAETFSLSDESGTIVFSAPITPLENGFLLMDFSAFTLSGRYRLSVGGLSTQFFVIGKEAFVSAAWKTLNFFNKERCGVDVPGVHAPCHLDVICRHPDGREKPACGGWHDAADVSIGPGGTARHILSMLQLADAVKEDQPALYTELLEEARFGLTYLMNGRFGDSYRVDGTILGIWTNNIRGDFDDITVNATNSASLNLACAQACAEAVPHFMHDAVFSRWLRLCAEEDYAFGINAFRDTDSVTDNAQAALCCLSLYKLTQDAHCLDRAAAFAHKVLACQQTEPRADLNPPICGYFYEDTAHTRPLSFFHNSSEQHLAECFIALLAAVPGHPDAPLWQRSLELSAQYFRLISSYIPPYGIFPAGLYEVGNTDYSTLYHEGEAVGLPTMAEYNAQVRNGISLGSDTYLRRFPVAYQFRGFNVTLMGKAKSAFALAEHFRDRELYDIAVRQLEYILGCNPFAMSLVYGEGYDYPPLYSGFAGDLVGSVPVGIETYENDDEPYMPMQSNATYKEIWSHAVGFLMECIAQTHCLHPNP